MIRTITPWLAGFLIGVCAWLCTFARVDHRASALLTSVEKRRSPMDMPVWYSAPLQKGERYIDLGPIHQLATDEKTTTNTTKRVTRKASAVRGYW